MNILQYPPMMRLYLAIDVVLSIQLTGSRKYQRGEIMIQKWAKLLPYGLLMWLVRNHSSVDGQATIKFDKEYLVSYYRLGPSEFVVYSQQFQDKFNARQEERRQTKLDKKLDKLNDKLRNDYSLKSALRKQFDDEFLNEKIEW